MIDVMMILTIFLAVMAFLPQVRTSLEAQLPQASSATETPPSVTIELTRQGINMDEKPLSPDELTAAIQAEVKKNPDTSFVIAADKALPYEQVIGLLDRVKASGAKRIALAATKP
jgi:biopolymer transport protein ExbD